MGGWTRYVGLVRRDSRWSEVEAREALAAWRASGETALAFAASRGVSAQRLWYWQKRLAQSVEPEAVGFTEVRVDHPARSVEIEYGPVRLRVRESIDAERVAAIVRALARED
jgi:hypothetical protein